MTSASIVRSALVVGTGFMWIGSAMCQSIPRAVTQPAMTDTVLERQAALVLKVKDYDTALRAVLGTAGRSQSVITGGHTEVNARGKKHGWVDIESPAAEFPILIDNLRPLGTLYADRITTRSHSSEYEELARRVQQLRDHERRLLDLLGSPRLRGSDILFIQDRVFRAGIDEAILLQSRADLERMARAGRISIELFEPGAAPGPPRRTFNPGESFRSGVNRARNSLSRNLSRAATALAFAVIYAPVWVPCVLIVGVLILWLVRRVIPAASRMLWRALPRLCSGVQQRITLVGNAVAARMTTRRSREE